VKYDPEGLKRSLSMEEILDMKRGTPELFYIYSISALSVHGCTRAVLLDFHRLCSVIEGEIEPISATLARDGMGWQSVISQGKIP